MVEGGVEVANEGADEVAVSFEVEGTGAVEEEVAVVFAFEAAGTVEGADEGGVEVEVAVARAVQGADEGEVQVAVKVPGEVARAVAVLGEVARAVAVPGEVADTVEFASAGADVVETAVTVEGVDDGNLKAGGEVADEVAVVAEVVAEVAVEGAGAGADVVEPAGTVGERRRATTSDFRKSATARRSPRRRSRSCGGTDFQRAVTSARLSPAMASWAGSPRSLAKARRQAGGLQGGRKPGERRENTARTRPAKDSAAIVTLHPLRPSDPAVRQHLYLAGDSLLQDYPAEVPAGHHPTTRGQAVVRSPLRRGPPEQPALHS